MPAALFSDGKNVKPELKLLINSSGVVYSASTSPTVICLSKILSMELSTYLTTAEIIFPPLQSMAESHIHLWGYFLTISAQDKRSLKLIFSIFLSSSKILWRYYNIFRTNKDKKKIFSSFFVKPLVNNRARNFVMVDNFCNSHGAFIISLLGSVYKVTVIL